jgi:hypothetical protein
MKGDLQDKIVACLEEIVDCLCYQIDVPETHKVLLLNSLEKVLDEWCAENE